MAMTRLARTTEAIARIQGGVAPPVVPEVFSGQVRLTGRWPNAPFEDYVPGMQDHVLVAKYAGDGPATLKVDGKLLSSPSTPGTITLAPRGHDGEWRVAGAVVVSNIFLGHERLQSCADQVAGGLVPELMDRINFRDPQLFDIMRLACSEVESPGASSTLFLEQLIDLLCLQLLRGHASMSRPLARAPQRGLSAWQVRRVTAYMREHAASEITLQELANLVDLSRFHFCTAFRLATGYTPHEWLTTLRIDRARQLLRDPALRITHIAMAVGYQTPSAFAASFHKAVGVTPTEFRRRL